MSSPGTEDECHGLVFLSSFLVLKRTNTVSPTQSAVFVYSCRAQTHTQVGSRTVGHTVLHVKHTHWATVTLRCLALRLTLILTKSKKNLSMQSDVFELFYEKCKPISTLTLPLFFPLSYCLFILSFKNNFYSLFSHIFLQGISSWCDMWVCRKVWWIKRISMSSLKSLTDRTTLEHSSKLHAGLHDMQSY